MPQQKRLPFLPGLDGLRALAVIAVLLYHADLRWASGGFLGVEVFFVISGYLITALLLGEYAATGRIALRAFWLRRARRLLPAAFALMIAVLAYAALFLHGELARLRGDALAALLYVTNWYLIFGQRSYFEQLGRPSLLQHLWSLAVEEQFYLLWPPLLIVLLGLSTRILYRRSHSALSSQPSALSPQPSAPGPRPGLALLLLGGALLSTALMAQYQPGLDPTRVYYGTDTRAAGFLVGAALACVWRHGLLPRMAQLEMWLLDAAGILALTILCWLAWQAQAFDPRLYRGGLLWVALLSATLIAGVAHPQARALPALLGLAPLRWLGLRSYSIYLWHWPVYMLSRPQLDLPLAGLPLLALRLALTLMLAEISFQLIERPFRERADARWWQRFRATSGPARWNALTYVSGAAATLAVFLAILGWQVARAEAPPPPPYLAQSAVLLSSAPTPSVLPTFTPTLVSSATPAPSPAPEPAALLPTPTPAATATAEPTATPAPPPEPTPLPRILAIGDSVMLGAAQQFVSAYGNIEVDAAVSRTVDEGIANLAWRRDNGALGEIVVVHLGNNGPISEAQFDALMGTLADVPRVLVLTYKLPRWWQEPNNGLLWNRMGNHSNAVLLDWHGASVDNPGLFWDDGLHLRPEGAAAYVQLVLANTAGP
ncbi:MAG: acyltransferase [Roseiflexaceae bacterium]|nr:acyltransferase [Roseiflexaceae bacterium]